MLRLVVAWLFLAVSAQASSSGIPRTVACEKVFPDDEAQTKILGKKCQIKNYGDLVKNKQLMPVTNISFQVLNKINICLHHGGSYDPKNKDFRFNDWSVEVYELNDGSVVRFYISKLEDAEILCFLDEKEKVLKIQQ